MAIAGGLLTAVCWAAAALVSSIIGRRIGPLVGLAWVNVVALVAASAAALAVHGLPSGVGGDDLAWASVYGVASTCALAAAFAGMTIGPVGIVAPMVSTEGAFATLIGVALGDAVAGATGAALAVVVVGIVLSGLELGERAPGSTVVSPRAVALGIAAAALFGLALVGGSRADALDPLWTVAIGRVFGVALLTVPLAVTGRLASPAGATPLVFVSAFADLVGFATFIAVSDDGVAIPAVLGSQYATLVVIAGFFLFAERLRPWQWAGVALTITGTALVAATSG